jgi:hypothetical protein
LKLGYFSTSFSESVREMMLITGGISALETYALSRLCWSICTESHQPMEDDQLLFWLSFLVSNSKSLKIFLTVLVIGSVVENNFHVVAVVNN